MVRHAGPADGTIGRRRASSCGRAPTARSAIVEVFDGGGDGAAPAVTELARSPTPPASATSACSSSAGPPGRWAPSTSPPAPQATVTAGLAGFGGDYARVRTDCRLSGRGATGDLLAAYFGDGDQTLDFRTFQDHVAPDTTSNLLFKGAVERPRRGPSTPA